MREKKELGASLVEATLITLCIAIVSITSISSLKDRMEAYLWLVTLFIISPEERVDSGVIIDVWAPRSAFLIFGNIVSPDEWCRVILTTQSWNKRPEPLVQNGDIIECASTPA